MKASETKFQQILEGTKVYIVPIFQREYCWTKNEWKTLWQDLMYLLRNLQNQKSLSHFMGAMVNIPFDTTPEGVTKFLLIDGQQRLTTIMILLILIRDFIKPFNPVISEEIQNTLIVNPYKKEEKEYYYKLIPSEFDKKAFQDLVNGIDMNSMDQINDVPIIQSYNFFFTKFKEGGIYQDINQLKQLKEILINHLSLVSIVLDQNENPYLVFESLNAKGKPLTYADLVRNYMMMHIPKQKQNEIYQEYWKPIEDRFQTSNHKKNVKKSMDFAEFIRHFIMRDGEIINKNDVYFYLKRTIERLKEDSNQEQIDIKKLEFYIKDLNKFSSYYEKFVNPEKEEDPAIRKKFKNLNQIEVTTAYPLLLRLYDNYKHQNISQNEFLEILHTLETFLIRRYVCNVPTNQLNKIFQSLNKKLQETSSNEYLKIIKQTLSKHMPLDDPFFDHLCNTKIVGSEKQKRFRLILASIEEKLNPRETVNFDNLTIEHIMPRTLTEEWKQELGEDYEAVYKLYLNTIGNLTLTGNNSKLSNNSFKEKKEIFINSNLSLNRYFRDIETWNSDAIQKRSEELANIALKIWPFFGEIHLDNRFQSVTGTRPNSLYVLGKEIKVESWREVLIETMNAIIEKIPEKFYLLARQFPKYINKNREELREARELPNGYFIEVNLSAEMIKKLCIQYIEGVGSSSEDWKVRF